MAVALGAQQRCQHRQHGQRAGRGIHLHDDGDAAVCHVDVGADAPAVAVGRQAELARLDLREQVQREAQLSRIQTFSIEHDCAAWRLSLPPRCQPQPRPPLALSLLQDAAAATLHPHHPACACKPPRPPGLELLRTTPDHVNAASQGASAQPQQIAPQLHMRGLRRLALHATVAMASPSQPDAIRQRSHQHRQARQPAQHGGKRLRIPPLHARAGSTCGPV